MSSSAIGELVRHGIPEKYFSMSLERLLEAHRGTDATPRELFASVDDDFWLWALTAGRRESEALRDILPGVPEEEMQLTTNALSGDVALEDGFRVYRLFRDIYQAYRGDLGSAGAILDFGCGWGRILRFFLKDVDPNRLWGVDAYEERIVACRENGRWGNFELVDPFPPLEFADGTFDLVFCYSVLSHLSEQAHRRWLDEFTRILKPGGLLIATTFGRELIEQYAHPSDPDQPPFITAELPAVFQDTDFWLDRYDSGHFCFDSSVESYGDVSSWFGYASVPREFVLRRWGQRLEVLDYIDDRNVCLQNVAVARR